ncbi:MAG: hypothetical protein V3V84_08810 [Candidatus Bathyarchaeia archaeon]
MKKNKLLSRKQLQKKWKKCGFKEKTDYLKDPVGGTPWKAEDIYIQLIGEDGKADNLIFLPPGKTTGNHHGLMIMDDLIVERGKKNRGEDCG